MRVWRRARCNYQVSCPLGSAPVIPAGPVRGRCGPAAGSGPNRLATRRFAGSVTIQCRLPRHGPPDLKPAGAVPAGPSPAQAAAAPAVESRWLSAAPETLFMSMNPTRRDFFKQAAVGLTAARLAGAAEGQPRPPMPAGTPRPHICGLPENWRAMRKFDVHNHVWAAVNEPRARWHQVEAVVEAARVLGINRLYCSRPITGGAMADIEAVRHANDAVLAAMRRYPDVIFGYCFVQPGNGPAALDEIERCIEAGMVGVKLYNQYKYTDSAVFPIAEKCIEGGLIFLGHSAHLTDPKALALQPKTSDSLDYCALSRRYPELLLVMGHVNGGGDWEWAIKGLRDCPNVYVDTSGSVLEDRTIEMCVRELGVHRVLFATDATMEGGVGKVLSADLTPEQREDIFWRNADQLLARRKS